MIRYLFHPVELFLVAAADLLGAVGLWRVIDTEAWSIFRHRLDAQHRRAIMQCVVENSFDGIAIVNQDGVIEVLNPAAEGILGKPKQELIGAPIHSHIPWTREIEQLYGGTETDDSDQPARKAVGPTEFNLMRDDGVEQVIELMVSMSKLPVATGLQERRAAARFVHIYTFRDVTERKRVEDAQKMALAEAIAASRSKTEFLANMSHELRTPLNAVIGFAELIKAQHFGPIGAPQYVEYIDDIFNSGQYLLAVINDILDMSKIEAGEMQLTEAVFDIHEVTGSCLRLISERAHKGGLDIAVELPDGLPWIRADQRMVKQMLLNLLTNAVKFTPEGGRITLRAEIDGVGCYVISVIDTGIGIAPKDMERIFQPFGQADAALAREYEGTGLGLPLVKAMAELHGALLVIDSTPNAGTTAAIRFPVARVTDRISRHAENRAA